MVDVTTLDLAGNTVKVYDLKTGVSDQNDAGSSVLNAGTAQTITAQKTFSAGINTKQAVNNVHDTAPTAAELTTSFGAPATLGRGFVGTVDDADGDTNSYIVWTSDASFFFLKGTKAS
jgi:hypothetical protein